MRELEACKRSPEDLVLGAVRADGQSLLANSGTQPDLQP